VLVAQPARRLDLDEFRGGRYAQPERFLEGRALGVEVPSML
jgi:hypothetical protein